MDNISNTTSQNHLTLDDRYKIEEGLNEGITLSMIAKQIGKAPSTVSREIQRHRLGDNLRFGTSNDCAKRFRCPITNLCDNCDHKSKHCATCRKVDCRRVCSKYYSDTCRFIRSAPHVCNGCTLLYDCRKQHFYYRASSAHTSYLETLAASREGVSLSREQLFELDSLITPLLFQGQSVAQIYATHKDEIPCSIKTIYTYIDQGILSVRNIDLPKKVKYKPRHKHKKNDQMIDYEYRKGRTYKDFQEFIAHNYDKNVVELDTVHGNSSKGKVMLTLLFRNSNLMLVFLMEECTQICVKQVFDDLTDLLGIEEFKKCFPVIITDNGPEFKNPLSIECTDDGEIRTNVFFCDPLASWQKGKLEKNHEYIRKIIPKGISLNSYTQEDMLLLMNHINSTPRASLNNKCPFQLAEILNSNILIKKMKLKPISPDLVVLKPTLFNK